YKSNPDIDSSRTELNYHLKPPEEKYRQLVLKRIEESGAKKRSNSIVLQDALVTASPEWLTRSLMRLRSTISTMPMNTSLRSLVKRILSQQWFTWTRRILICICVLYQLLGTTDCPPRI
ncbi:MAG: plasmid recombination protein, partial [Eubacterium sp.]|nr:plasmid recombination protein [Candidatus Colimonas fimequi]